MSRFTHHIFICTNERPASDARGCCKAKDAQHVVEAFKAEISKRGLKGKVRANSSGCLDNCSQGVSVVVYPEAVWYGKVTPADVPEIVEKHVVAGEPVARLRVNQNVQRGRELPGFGLA